MTQFCFEGVKKLQRESKHHIDVSCVLSEPEYIELCGKYGFNWVFAENLPLGNKMNAGIKSTMKFKYDYLMIMNSDNVIKTELVDQVYAPFFESLNPYFGVSKVTYVNWGTNDAREFEYNFMVLGIGKCLHRDLVNKSQGNMYRPELNKCLDATMMDNMIALGAFPTIVNYEGQLAMDFKSEVNIWPWERFQHKGKIVEYAAS